MASSAALTTTHLPQLRSLLAEWQERQPPHKGFVTLIPETLLDKTTIEGKDVIVAFRTRPPLESELGQFTAIPEESDAAGDHPVEFCQGISVPSAEPGIFVTHVSGMKWSGPTLVHKSYEADLAFGPDVSNEEVYQRAIALNDLLPLVLSGGVGCVLAYGQTGSGKTFTMTGLEERVARDIFAHARNVGQRMLQSEKSDMKAEDIFEFSVTFLELLGKRATDLVEQPNEVDDLGNPIRKEVPIHEDKVGDVRPRLISTIVKTPEELQALISKALDQRRTNATSRNATSSRSHALLTIRVKNALLPYAEEGQLVLVDLAGSERYEDSKQHDKQRMAESRENNKSLMALKECVRAKARMATEDGFVHIPWRSNKLTMLLKPVFDIESRQPSKTVIVAHVSPHIQDTAHSTNTLGYAAPFKTAPPILRAPVPHDAADPRTWDSAYTHTWLTQAFERRARARRQRAWETGESEARARGVRLRPLDPQAAVELAVDIERLCPPGMTALALAKLYTIEFVEQCMVASPVIERGAPRTEVDAVRNTALGVAGELAYMVLTAKTRKRSEVMRGRNRIEEGVYGESPVRYVAGTNRRVVDFEVYPHHEIVDARMALGEFWDTTVNFALKNAKETGEDMEEAKSYAVKSLMDAWRAEVKAKAQEA